MNYDELPHWAKVEVKEIVTNEYKARHPQLDENEVEKLVNEYINCQTFGIMYNAKGECLYKVRW